jgi:hypothetical protein
MRPASTFDRSRISLMRDGRCCSQPCGCERSRAARPDLLGARWKRPRTSSPPQRREHTYEVSWQSSPSPQGVRMLRRSRPVFAWRPSRPYGHDLLTAIHASPRDRAHGLGGREPRDPGWRPAVHRSDSAPARSPARSASRRRSATGGPPSPIAPPPDGPLARRAFHLCACVG